MCVLCLFPLPFPLFSSHFCCSLFSTQPGPHWHSTTHSLQKSRPNIASIAAMMKQGSKQVNIDEEIRVRKENIDLKQRLVVLEQALKEQIAMSASRGKAVEMQAQQQLQQIVAQRDGELMKLREALQAAQTREQELMVSRAARLATHTRYPSRCLLAHAVLL